MPQKLEDLTIDEVSLVDRPANSEKGVPRARIALFKRDASIPAEGLPDSKANVQNNTQGVTTMTLENIEKKMNEQDATLAALTAANLVLKTESELVLKMSDTERLAYADMTEDLRKNYAAGDAEARKTMLADAVSKMKKEIKGEEEDGEPEPDGDEDAEGNEPDKKKFPFPKKSEKTEKSVEKAKKALLTKLDEVESLNTRLAKAEAELEAGRKQARLLKFAKRAEEELPHTPGSPEEKGDLVMKLADALGDNSEGFTKMMGQLKEADRAIASRFIEVGKSGGSIPAEKLLFAKVAEIRKRDNIDESHAMGKVMEESPELYLDYERQQRRILTQQ